jgi:hypothetical protein
LTTLSASPAAADAATPADAPAPLRFPSRLRLTPDQFALLCAENRDAVLELAADGRVLAMTPTESETGARHARLEMRLLLWADRQGGWKVFGSSTGFRLPDGSVLSPDPSGSASQASAQASALCAVACTRRWCPALPGWLSSERLRGRV